jgi:hypothetical protein
MKRPVALIFGGDGFDSDVGFNLKDLYSKLGYKVLFSKYLLDAELLCIMRVPESQLGLAKFQVVHIFDYACVDRPLFFSAIHPEKKIRVFFPSIGALKMRIKKYPNLTEISEVLMPPVSVDRWTFPITKRKNEFIHIGNFKSFYSDRTDKNSLKFLNLLKENQIPVWGSGWHGYLSNPQIKGRLPLFNAPKLYAATKVGLGMMYPFQRGLTISGRFWQGPLAGCLIFSECTLHDELLPGVSETNYENFSNLVEYSTQVQPQALQELARIYWDKKFKLTLEKFDSHIEGSGREANPPRSARTSFRSINTRMWNRIRELKYRLRLDV